MTFVHGFVPFIALAMALLLSCRRKAAAAAAAAAAAEEMRQNYVIKIVKLI